MRLRPYALALLLCLPGTADDLLMNGFPTPVRTVVYEMTGTPADQVAATLRRALPHAELIDAASADEGALRSKLAGPWVLVSLLSERSQLLRRTATPLPLRIENGVFHWGDFAAPAEETRAAFMGKNPFGGGPCLVFAVPMGGFGLSIRSASSYVIYRGNELAARGVYDRNFVEQGVLSPEDAAADIDEFFATIGRAHPLPGIERLARLRAEARAAVAPKGRIRIEDLASVLLSSAAALRDGHTGVMWRVDPGNQPTAGKRFPPFLIDADDGRFRITAPNDERLRGAELLEANGVPVEGFFRPALERCSGETAIFRARLLAADQAFWWWLTNVFGSGAVQMRVQDASGTAREQSVDTITFSEYAKLAPPRQLARKEEVSIFDFGKIAHWVYPAFSEGAEQRARIDEAIRQVRDTGTTDLILDLRGNGGGSSVIGDYIFRRIWPQPVEQSGGRMKLSPEAPDAVYSGRLWLLVDNGTFSAANMFAATFRDYQMGTILGHETGEPPISFGDPATFRLKHSGIPYRVSTKQFFPPKPRPGDDQHGVIPDVKLDSSTLGAFFDQEDPELAFTIDMVRRRQK